MRFLNKFFLSLILLLPLAGPLSAVQWPQPLGYLSDFAHVVPSDKSQAIQSLLYELEQKTGVQVAVVTVDSLEGGDVDGAAADLFKTWGIGHKKKDDGVLVLISIQDRKDRIEVGYGMEGVLTDGQMGLIRREGMEPYFKQGDYGLGLWNAAAAIAGIIAQNAGVTLAEQASVQPMAAQQRGSLGMRGTFFLFFLLFSILMSFTRRGRRGYWGGGFYGGGWGGGGGFGGGGGGGFGGFGGGMSGGGGSSGGW